MPLDAHALRHWTFGERHQTYTDRESLFYALSIGFGADPMDARELPFVFEGQDVADQRTVPTMAAVLCHPGPWIGDPRTGATRAQVVHGEQRMRFHAPLPAAGRVVSRARVLGVQDKGADKGALVHVQREISDATTGQLLTTLVHTSFCRADGGFEGSFGPELEPHALPDRPAERSIETPTRADAALWYRLNADRNPLHAEPEAARRAGFLRPILHGLCTCGIAARLLIMACLGGRADRLASLDVRFSSPMYPGETLRLECWQDDDVLSFRAFAQERGKKVLDNGRATISR